MAITFEGYERRINQINKTLNEYGIKDIEEAKKICDDKGIDVYNIVKSTQPICFENACWAYTVGAAIAIKKGDVKAAVEEQQTLQQQSERDFRHSVSLDQLLMIVK